jgi:hypothetical protein
MLKKVLARIVPAWLLLFVLAGPMPVVAQEDKDKDKTGTNPVNFTYDFRLISEMQEFQGGGGSQVINTVEFRWPLGRDIANLKGPEGRDSIFYNMGTRIGMRVRARTQTKSLNNTGPAPFGTSEVSGIGDFDMRILGLAYGSAKVLVAVGLEAFFDTASNPALGSGNTSLGPQVFVGFPGILGGRSLFIPGYQYVFDVAGQGNVSRSQIDLYFVWLLAEAKNWLIVNPQFILDHELSEDFGTFETEWGFMIVPKYGVSGYIRPGFGFWDPKLYSWNFEFGLKFVWQ